MQNTQANLHLNEMPHDVPSTLKELFLQKIKKQPWNRYPQPFADEVATQISAWLALNANQVLLAPGSSALIRLLLTYFGLSQRHDIIILRPSFAYYEQFCQQFLIPYRTWDLNEQSFAFELETLKDLKPESVVFLTTPNNPTGNEIPKAMLLELLTKNPKTLFIVDEAYGEFAITSCLEILDAHPNLLVLRTFSKALGAAGIRLGFACGTPERIGLLKKLTTPWQISFFTTAAAEVILEDIQGKNLLQSQLKELQEVRDLLYEKCIALGALEGFEVFPSQANFLLYRFSTQQKLTGFLSRCAAIGCIVKDLSNEPLLSRCVRVSIGLPQHSLQILELLQEKSKEQS